MQGQEFVAMIPHVEDMVYFHQMQVWNGEVWSVFYYDGRTVDWLFVPIRYEQAMEKIEKMKGE